MTDYVTAYNVIRRLPCKGVLEAYVYRNCPTYEKACEIKAWYENLHKDDDNPVSLYITKDAPRKPRQIYKWDDSKAYYKYLSTSMPGRFG